MEKVLKFVLNHKKRVAQVIVVISVLLVIIFLASSQYVVVMDDAIYDETDSANIPYIVNKHIRESALNGTPDKDTTDDNAENNDTENNGIENKDIKTKNSKSGGYALDVDLDVLTKEIIKDIKKHDGRIYTYLSRGNAHEYLKKMITAQCVTQYPDLRTADKIGTEVPKGEFQGIIKFIRNKSDGTEKLLEYMPLGEEDSTDRNTLYGLINQANNNVKSAQDEVLNYFSIDVQGNLIIANWSEVITKATSGEYETDYVPNEEEADYSDEDRKKIENVPEKIEYTYSAYSVNYKTVISKYTMPFNYLWAFLVCGRDEDFVSDFADLVLDSSIEISIYDNLTEIHDLEIEAYNDNLWEATRTSTRTLVDHKLEGKEDVGEWSELELQGTTHYYDIEYTETYANAITIVATYIDIWYMEYSANYTYEVEDSGESKEIVREEGDELYTPSELEALGNVKEGPWTTVSSSGGPEYDDRGIQIGYTTLIEEQEKIDIAFQNQINQRTFTTFYRTIQYKYTLDGNPIVKEKIDKSLKKGDEGYPNFCALYAHSKHAKGNIEGVEEWLFTIIESNADTINMLELTKYMLYCATGLNFGVKEFDFTVFNPDDFITVTTAGSSASLLKEYIRYFEHSTPPPTNADKTKYIVENVNGNPTVGYGVDLKTSGYASVFLAAGYSITVDSEIDIDFVDSIEDEILNNRVESVTAMTSGLNLTGYQINALVSRAYNCGVSGALSTKRDGKTFSEAYKAYWKESDDQFPEKNSNANFNHSLYSTYMSKPTTSNGTYLRGLEIRRRSEWTLFQTGYYNVLGKWHTDGSSIVGKAKEIHEYMEANAYTYCVYGTNKSEECRGSSHGLNTTFLQSKTGYKHSCCATFVSWVLQECGYLSDSEHQNGANALQNLLKSKGFQTITNASDLQPGDILCYDGHIEIYAGDNRIYNAGSGRAIRSSSPQVRTRSFSYALRANS